MTLGRKSVARKKKNDTVEMNVVFQLLCITEITLKSPWYDLRFETEDKNSRLFWRIFGPFASNGLVVRKRNAPFSESCV